MHIYCMNKFTNYSVQCIEKMSKLIKDCLQCLTLNTFYFYFFKDDHIFLAIDPTKGPNHHHQNNIHSEHSHHDHGHENCHGHNHQLDRHEHLDHHQGGSHGNQGGFGSHGNQGGYGSHGSQGGYGNQGGYKTKGY